MRVEHDGVGLNVEVEGTEGGPVVAFLHGVSGSSRTYGWLPPEITDGRRIVRIDLRGHGDSDHASGSYFLHTYGEDVAAILREVGGGPAVVVGHSLGGSTGWWLAQNEPGLLAGAFLEDPPLYMGEPAEHANNVAAAMFPAIRDNAIAMREDGLDDEGGRGAARSGADARRATTGDLMMADGLLARAHAHLVMDPEVLTMAADNRTLGETDVDAPVGVPVLDPRGRRRAGVHARARGADERDAPGRHRGPRRRRRSRHPRREGAPGRVRRSGSRAFLAQHAPVGARA